MSEIVTFSDRKQKGTFAQIKLDDGKRILVSLTQTEIVILKLAFAVIPAGNIFKHDISEFLDFFCVRVKQIGMNGSLLKAIVEYILPCKTLDEVAAKLNTVIDGHSDPRVRAEVQRTLEKQLSELFSSESPKEPSQEDAILSKLDARSVFSMSRAQWNENVRRAVIAGKAKGIARGSDETGLAMASATSAGELVVMPNFSGEGLKPDFITVVVGYRDPMYSLPSDSVLNDAIEASKRQMEPEYIVIGNIGRGEGWVTISFSIMETAEA